MSDVYRRASRIRARRLARRWIAVASVLTAAATIAALPRILNRPVTRIQSADPVRARFDQIVTSDAPDDFSIVYEGSPVRLREWFHEVPVVGLAESSAPSAFVRVWAAPRGVLAAGVVEPSDNTAVALAALAESDWLWMARAGGAWLRLPEAPEASAITGGVGTHLTRADGTVSVAFASGERLFFVLASTDPPESTLQDARRLVRSQQARLPEPANRREDVR